MAIYSAWGGGGGDPWGSIQHEDPPRNLILTDVRTTVTEDMKWLALPLTIQHQMYSDKEYLGNLGHRCHRKLKPPERFQIQFFQI